MTDNQIIKAFKRCYLSDEINCGNCAFTNCPPNSCITEMTKSVFDLINRQKAEIERLSSFVTEERCYEIAREMIPQFVSQARADAIKEFMEMLTKVWGHYPLNFMTSVDAFYSTAKQIAREIAGETDVADPGTA